MFTAGFAAFMATFSWKKVLLKVLPYAAAILAVLGAIWGVYHLGSKDGSHKVQTKWDAQKAADTIANQKALTKLREDAAKKETTHQLESQRISDELADANQKYASTVAALDAGFHQRLHNSEQRATYYQHLSTAGTAQQEYLASHAAELDRSLEEGRRLVQELAATVGQRDAQNRALGQQILTDRSLIGEKNGSDPASTK